MIILSLLIAYKIYTLGTRMTFLTHYSFLVEGGFYGRHKVTWKALKLIKTQNQTCVWQCTLFFNYHVVIPRLLNWDYLGQKLKYGNKKQCRDRNLKNKIITFIKYWFKFNHFQFNIIRKFKYTLVNLPVKCIRYRFS